MTEVTKKVLIWASVAVGLLLLLIGMSKLATSEGGSSYGSNTSITLPGEIVTEDEHVKGNPEAPVTIVEYSDFECPACARTYPLLSQIVEDMPDDVRLIYRHYPLRQIHPNAQLAAQASEAAALQGKFYEMHDSLFNTQSTWSRDRNPEEFFVELAVSIGLNEEQFRDDLTSREAARAVNDDSASATGLRLSGTPSIFLNGESYQIQSYDQLKRDIEAAAAQTN